MGYQIPAGYSRITCEIGAISPLGSAINFGFGVSVDPGEPILDAVESWLTENWAPRATRPYRINRIEARNDVAVLDRSLSIEGARVGAVMPPNTAVLVRATSGLVGRTNRGRIYLPGMLLDGDIIEGGQIEPDWVVELQEMMVNLGATLETLPASVVILHSGVGTPTLATGVQVEGIAATQRRRLRA